MANVVHTPLELHSPNAIAVTVDKLAGGQVISNRQSLKDYSVVAARPWLQVEQQGSRTQHLVRQTAAHPNGEVKLVWLLHGISCLWIRDGWPLIRDGATKRLLFAR